MREAGDAGGAERVREAGGAGGAERVREAGGAGDAGGAEGELKQF